jgi:hypothetical protein
MGSLTSLGAQLTLCSPQKETATHAHTLSLYSGAYLYQTGLGDRHLNVSLILSSMMYSGMLGWRSCRVGWGGVGWGGVGWGGVGWGGGGRGGVVCVCGGGDALMALHWIIRCEIGGKHTTTNNPSPRP